MSYCNSKYHDPCDHRRTNHHKHCTQKSAATDCDYGRHHHRRYHYCSSSEKEPLCPPPVPPCPPPVPPYPVPTDPMPTCPMPTYPMPTCPPPFEPIPWAKPCPGSLPMKPKRECHDHHHNNCPPPCPPRPFPFPPAMGATAYLTATVTSSTNPIPNTSSANLQFIPQTFSGITANGTTISFAKAGTYAINLDLPFSSVAASNLTAAPIISAGNITPLAYQASLDANVTNSHQHYNLLLTIPANGTLSFTVSAGTASALTLNQGELIIYQIA